MTDITVTNLVSNGSFETYSLDGSDRATFTGWDNHDSQVTEEPQSVGTIRIDDADFKYGTVSVYFDNDTGTAGSLSVGRSFSTTSGHIYYATTWGLVNNPSTDTVNIHFADDNFESNWGKTTNDSAFERISTIYTSSSSSEYIYVEFVTTATNSQGWADGVVVIDLTSAFGSGNEPSKAAMDSMLLGMGSTSAPGWFDSHTFNKSYWLNCVTNGNFESSATAGWTTAGSGTGGVELTTTSSKVKYGNSAVHITSSTDGQYYGLKQLVLDYGDSGYFAQAWVTCSFTSPSSSGAGTMTVGDDLVAGTSVDFTDTTAGTLTRIYCSYRSSTATPFVEIKGHNAISEVTYDGVFVLPLDTAWQGYTSNMPNDDATATVLTAMLSSNGYYGPIPSGSVTDLDASPSTRTTPPGAAMTLTWTPSADTAITNYKITRSTSSGGTYTTIATGISTSATSYKDETTNAGTTYYYYIIGYNSEGDGPDSNQAHDTTYSLPGIPGSLTGSFSTTAKTINLSWSAPSSGGSSILYYNIYQGSTSNLLTTTASTSVSYTSSSFSAGTSYTFLVSAYTNVGEGATASVSRTSPSVHTPGISAIADVVVVTPVMNLSVTYDYTSSASLSSIVIYGKKSGGSYSSIHTFSSPSTSPLTYVHTPVDASSTYYYYCVASSAWGNSTSTTINLVSASAPGAPGSPALSFYAYSTVAGISWDVPSKGYASAVLVYEIQNTTDGTNWTSITTGTCSGDDSHRYFNDSSPKTWNTEYKYRVNASNAIGTSAWQETAWVYTPTGPTAPVSVAASIETYRNTPFIRIEWLEEDLGADTYNSADYVIYRKIYGESSYTPIKTNKYYDLSFYDPYFTQGVEHSYKIYRSLSGGESSSGTEVTITPAIAPRTRASVTAGTDGFTIHGVMFPYTDGNPQLQIHVVAPPSDISDVTSVFFQWAKEGEDYVTYSGPKGVDHLNAGTFEAINETTDYGTTYKLKAYTTNSSGELLHESNVVSITTYSPDGAHLPNVYPNPYYISGLYDETTNLGALNAVPKSPYTVSQLADITSTTNGRKLGMKMVYDSSVPDNYIDGTGAFKFPPFSYDSVYSGTTGVVRYFAILTKGQHATTGTTSPQIRVNANTDSVVPISTFTMLAYNSSSTTKVNSGLMSDIILNGADVDYTTYQGQFKLFFINYDGTVQTGKNYVYETSIIDLSEAFGGNGGDIDDAMYLANNHDLHDHNNVEITPAYIVSAIAAAMNNNSPSSSSWYTLASSGLAYKPIFKIPQPTFNNANETDFTITACDDNVIAQGTSIESHGGMDKSGGTPIVNYVLEYKAWNESDYTTITVPLTAFTGTTAVVTASDLEPSTKYYVRYKYINEIGITSDPSDSTVILTPPRPRKVTYAYAQRRYVLSTTPHGAYLNLNWNRPLVEDDREKPSKYFIYIGTDKNNLKDNKIEVVADPEALSANYEIRPDNSICPIVPETLYYYRISAYNSWGEGQLSDLRTVNSTTLPDEPQDVFVEFQRNVKTDNVPTVVWNMPDSDGGAGETYGSEQEFVGYRIKVATAVATASSYPSYTTLDVGTATLYQELNGYAKMNKYDTIAIEIAAKTNYTNNTSKIGPYYGPIYITFATVSEILRFRGEAETPGRIKLEFSERESYEQPQDSTGNDMYWVVAYGTTVVDGDIVFQDLPAGMTLENLKYYFDTVSNDTAKIAQYIFAVSDDNDDWTLETANGKKGWPVFVDKDEVRTVLGNDEIGDYLDVFIPMYPYRLENTTTEDVLYDVYVSYEGDSDDPLSGLNTLMIVTDYTTDIYFKDGASGVVLSTGTAGYIQWRVDSAMIAGKTYSNENVPQKSQVFQIQIGAGYTLKQIGAAIVAGDGINDGLQNQLNQYFVYDSSYKDLYIRQDGEDPFTVDVEYGTDDDNVNHLYVTVKCISEYVENQISSRTKYVSNLYNTTKANVYFVRDNMFELRSYEDMYGRNKPGSSTVNSTYVKRSYGFKFNLDYIRTYQEDEKADLSITPIPGVSSYYTIGIDAQGTTRTINITGVRVDNSNVWTFHAPYEYQVTSYENNENQVAEAGVIYTGTSNWGWCKFMKAIMGTFQFVDGPYRLIIMSVPSSGMMQYVLDRNCKYQYADGTYIIKAGYEDMCYVMLEDFQFTKSEQMYNAIEYQLTLRRVMPLGTSS